MTGLRVVVPGGASTVQDLGRPGYGRYGVPESGAMDRLALRLANRLVGNDEREACIEFAVMGGTYQASERGCRIAVAGGDFAVTVDDAILPPYRAIDLRPEARVAIERARTGVYGYVAVQGGFAMPPVLGSRSVHLRSGIGGGPLTPGTMLPLRQPAPQAGPPLGLDPALWPRPDGPLRFLWGPQDDLFTEKGKADFLSGVYRVALQSDRMGYRLEGPSIEHAGDCNIVSDGIVLGSVQVPGTGKPIVLLADRQSTGGYPKIATILSCDIRRLVQRRPDTAIRFEAVTLDEADAILRRDKAAFLACCDAIRPVAPDDLFRSERLLGLNLVDGFVSGKADDRA